MLYFFLSLGLFVKPPPLNETPGPSGPYLFKKKTDLPKDGLHSSVDNQDSSKKMLNTLFLTSILVLFNPTSCILFCVLDK
jgi:hypothetical protein